MPTSSLARLLATVLLVASVTAACGDDDGSSWTAADGGAGDSLLGGVCPSPLVVQTDWWPESEHGALYELLGDDYVVDAEAKSVTGSLVVDGGAVDTGVDIEIRSGGPAIGFSAPRVQMYTDESIHLGYSSTDGAVLASEDAPTLAVIAPLEKNPQIVMWDPATYPQVQTLRDLGELNVTILVFPGVTFPEVFVAQGIWSEDQLDPSYNGTPGRFIAEDGRIAQQGFASSEPHNYENVFTEWGRPVAYQLVHDTGFEIYSQPLAIRTDDLEDARPCLEEVVPIIQQAVVDFVRSPDRANDIILDTVATFDSGWVYDDSVAEFSTATMAELGLKGNGPDSVVGNFDLARVASVIDLMAEAGLDVPDGLTAADLVTNEFIDATIGF